VLPPCIDLLVKCIRHNDDESLHRGG
jgi:hypothetical protein